MTQPLVREQILIAEDEQVFRSLPDSQFSSLGATTVLVVDGVDALELLGGFTPDLMIYDIAMPRMDRLKPLEHIHNKGSQTLVLVIPAAENMADITKTLCLGVEDVLLKLVRDLNHLREMVFACFYLSMFNSRVEKKKRLLRDWDAMVDNPTATAKLLQGLQPLVQQVISQCRVNYRQLVAVDKPDLVPDIVALSENDLALYCLDVTRAGHNGILAALLLCTLFSGLSQEQLVHQNQQLPELGMLLRQVDHLFHQADLPGQFPLSAGYYHRELKNLILVSAGLDTILDAGKHQMQTSNGVPLGTLGNACLN